MFLSLRDFWSLLARYLRPHWRQVTLLAVLLFGGIALQLIAPQMIRLVLDAAWTSAGLALLSAAALGYLVIALVQRAAGLGAVVLGEQIGWLATNRLRADLLHHVLGLDLSFHKLRPPGELIERIDGDAGALAGFFAQLVVQLVGNLALVAGALVLLFREDWRAGLGLAVYALLAVTALGALQNLGARRWAANEQSNAELAGFLEERLAGLEDLRAAGAEGYVLACFEALLVRKNRRYLAARLTSNLSFLATNLLTALGYALALGLAVLLYQRGDTTIGGAFLIVAYLGIVSAPLERIREQAQELQRAAAGISRVRELLAFQPALVEHPRASLPPGPLAVSVEQVWFWYEDAGDGDGRWMEGPQDGGGVAGAPYQREPSPDTTIPPVPPSSRPTVHRSSRPTGYRSSHPTVLKSSPPAVLTNLTFALAPGHVLGLLGRTGSGKSTVARLLCRLYDPAAGCIRLSGVDLRDLACAELHARVGVVTQDVQLFQATLRDNLTLFDPRVDDQRLLAALAELGLTEWLSRLPQGLDTPLGAGGHGLSAGEAQLLAFARVFLADPGLVILDEASSRLDPATERLLEQAITRLLHGRTAIIIAHRLATVQRADQILILDAGQVAEYGPRAELAADAHSRFAGLLRTGMQEVLA